MLKDPQKPKPVIIGDQWYVAPPPDCELLEKQLKHFGLEQHDLVRQFMLHFNGFQEDLEGAGDFVTIECWEPIAGPGCEYIRDECQNFNEWEGSVCFYHACNGDLLLLHQTGKMGWWDMAMGEIRPLLDSFADFPEYYCNYIRHRWPFDSCGPVVTD